MVWYGVARGLAFALCCSARQKRGNTRASSSSMRSLQGLGELQMPACSPDQIRRIGEWSQGSRLDWRRGFVIGVWWPPSSNPLTSYSLEVVSSTLVTLPLGPDRKLRGVAASVGGDVPGVWERERLL